MIDLSVEFSGIKLKNPVMLASGVWDLTYTDIIDLNRIGGVIYKGISLEPREGNPPPRISETPCGVINSIGLENRGVKNFNSEILPELKKKDTAIFANIFGESVEEFSKVASELHDISGIEVNVSCPNVNKGGAIFGKCPKRVEEITRAVCGETDIPVIVKLSPDVKDIVEIARAAMEGGAAGVTASNTYTGMVIDIERKEPLLKRGYGGISGPAVKPLSLYRLYQITSTTEIPVIGSGGVMDYRDIIEYLIAGARAVQIGSAIFNNPYAPVEILENLKNWMEENEYRNLNSLRGVK